MKNCFWIILFVILISGFGISSNIHVSGSQSGTWSADTVFVDGDIDVNGKLEINLGTVVMFTGFYKIESGLNDKLIAIGTYTFPDPIIFTVQDTTGFYTYPDSSIGGWNGIRIEDSNYSAIDSLQYCVFEYSKKIKPYDSSDWIESEGGALAAAFSSVYLDNCTFQHNLAVNKGGGAIITRNNAEHITCSYNLFQNNRVSDGEGGGLFIDSAPISVKNNTFKNNYAKHSGGGLCLRNSSGQLCYIQNNKIYNNSTGTGGGGGGGIYIYGSSNAVLTGNLIYNNTSTSGGGISCHGTPSQYHLNIFSANNTIADNHSNSSGGGIILWNINYYSTNDIIWNNTSDISGYTVSFIDNSDSCFFNYSLIDTVTNGGGDWNSQLYKNKTYGNAIFQTGCKFTNPLLDTSGGIVLPYYLQENSPCINQGIPDTTGLYLLPKDFTGFDRILLGHFGRIDMGAYEYSTASSVYVGGDVNGEWNLRGVDTIFVTGDINADGANAEIYISGSKVIFTGYYNITIKNGASFQFDVSDFLPADTTGFYQNLNSTSGAWGGIRISNPSNISYFRGCTISYCKKLELTDNPYEKHGGGLFVENLSYNGQFLQNIDIDDCYVKDNNMGGALYLKDCSTSIYSCNPYNNRAGYGGGIAVINSDVEAISFNPDNCKAVHNGGGIYISNTTKTNKEFEITNSFLDENEAVNGGALYSENGDIVIKNTSIYNNSASQNGGAVYLKNSILLSINNNYYKNQASNGGAYYTQNHSLVNSYNDIIWENSGTNSYTIHLSTSETLGHDSLMFNYSLVDTNSSGTNWSNYNPSDNNDLIQLKTGCFSLDPHFTAPGNPFPGYYFIEDYSPCINAGTPDTAGLDLLYYDLISKYRIVGGRIDMGAYELQYIPFPYVINEVYYNSDKDSGCFTELKLKPGMDLSNYSLNGYSADGTLYASIDLSGNTVPADTYFVVAQDASVSGADLINSNADWNDNSGIVKLMKSGESIDVVSYGTNALHIEGTPAETASAGASLCRMPDGTDSQDNSADFSENFNTTPGAKNLYGSPSPDIFPTELNFGIAETGETVNRKLYVENSGTGPLQVTNIRVKDPDGGFALSGYTLPLNVQANNIDSITVSFSSSNIPKQIVKDTVIFSILDNPEVKIPVRVDFAKKVLINEMYFIKNSRRVKSDYAYTELFGPADYSLDNYKLAAKDSSGTVISEINLTGKTIPGDGYFVISEDSSVQNTDLVNSSVVWSSNDFALQLIYSADLIIDAAAFGNTEPLGEGTALQLPSPGEAVSRIPNGQDTDNNYDDFTETYNHTPGILNEVGLPAAVFTPNPADFGDVNSGSEKTISVEIRNTGSEILDITSVNFSESTEFFEIVESSKRIQRLSFSILPNSKDSLKLKFKPKASIDSTYSNTLIFAAIDIGNQSLDISGHGTLGELIFSPPSVDFGNVESGSSEDKKLVFQNNGSGTVSITNIAVQSGDSYFNYSDYPKEIVLASGEKDSVQITFSPKPSVDSTYADNIVFTTTELGDLTCSLSGHGVLGELAFTPSSVDFGDVESGSSENKKLVFQNNGSGTVSITNIAIQSGDSYFSYSDYPKEIVLASGEKDSVQITFSPKPSVDSTYADNIVFTTTELGDLTCSLSGHGVLGELTFSPPSVDFGDVESGSSENKKLVFQNNGSGTVSITNIAIQSGNTYFSYSDYPKEILLASGEKDSIQITFSPKPSVDSTYADNIVFTTTELGDLTCSLSGHGVLGELAFTPSSVDFGDVESGSSENKKLVFQNNGSGTVSITNIAIQSGDSYFSYSDYPKEIVLASGEKDSVQITFSPKPSVDSTYADNIVFTTTELGDLTCTLSGHGVLGELTFTPPSVDFGDVEAGSSDNKKLVFQNNGSGTVSITNIAIQSGDSYFSYSDYPKEIVLASGEKDSIQITFSPKPSVDSTYADNIVFTTTELGDLTCTLSGHGVLGELIFSPPSVDFGDVEAGSSDNKKLVFQNNGSGTVSITNIAIQSGNSYFSYSDYPKEIVLASGEKDSVQITFSPKPSVDSTYADNIVFTTTELGDLTCPLSGHGVLGVLTFIPASVDFGDVEAGSSDNKKLVFQNNGSGTVSITNIAIQSGNSYFSYSDYPKEIVLASGEKDSVQITFSPKPSVDSTYADNIVFTTTELGDLTCPLSGHGVLGVLTFIPASVDFGDVESGSSENKKLVFQNNGSGTVSITNIAIQSGNSYFSYSDYPKEIVLASGEKDSIQITFSPKPSVDSTYADNIVFTTTELGDLTCSLSGRGFTTSGGSISVNPEEIFFGEQNIGTSSVSHSLTILNNGESLLNISGITAPEGFQIQLGDKNKWDSVIGGFSLSEDESQIIEVRFSPTELIEYSGDIIIMSDDSEEPEYHIFVNGIGIEMNPAGVYPELVDFGGISADETSSEMIYIENRSTENLILQDIQIVGDDPEFFTYSIPVKEIITIPAGETDSIEITFNPEDDENRTYNSLVLLNFEGIAEEYSVDLTGEGLFPIPIFMPEFAVFPNTQAGSSSEIVLRIENIGGSELNILSIESNSEVFTAESINAKLEMTIPPYSADSLKLVFSPVSDIDSLYFGAYTFETEKNGNIIINSEGHGVFAAGDFNIQGKISYFESGVGIQGFNLILTGVLSSQSITDEFGYYSFENVPEGNILITPEYTDDSISGINALDYIRIKKHSLGLQNISEGTYQFTAADVTGDGSINALDYIKIKRRILGLDSEFPIGNWVFVPDVLEYNITSDINNANFLGIKIGDVDGSFSKSKK